MGLFNGNKEAAPANQRPTSENRYNPFSKIEESEGRSGGVYPVPGLYSALYVDCLKMKQNRKGEDIFIAEFDILQSDVPERRPGTRMSWVVNFRHDASPGNVKAFLAAVMNVPQNEVDAAGAQYACDEEKQPCHGRLVWLQAANTKTKAGNDFTNCTWRGLPNEMQAQAKELRIKAGFQPF